MINHFMNRTYKAGAYTRLSIVEDEIKESASITNQKTCIKDYADKNDIEIYDYYVDDGYSGGNFERPAFKKLLNDIECGLINCVITKDTSRLGREFIETGNYIYKYFPEKDVRYIAILDNYDSENPNGADDFIPFKTVVNDMYLRDTSRKIKNTRHGLMKEGLFVGSSVPYGYKRSDEDSRKLVIDEYAANIVKRIFKMKKDGIKDNMIARTLTNEGILPPNIYKDKKMNKTYTSNLWKASSIKTILTNEVYIGTMIQGKYERVSLKSKKKKLLPKYKWIIKKNNHEAIIKSDLFEKVNATYIKYNNDDTRCRKYDYLLKGLVVCADCGKTMLVRRCKSKCRKTKNQEYAVYCCRTYATYRNKVCSMHYYREEDLNKLVLNEIKSIFVKNSDNKQLDKQYEETLSKSNILEKYQNELNDSQNKIKELDKAISGLYVDKVSNIISEDEFTSIKSNLEKDRNVLNGKINNLKIMLDESKDTFMNEKTKAEMINEFLKAKKLNKQQVCDLVNKITIDKDKNVKIYFKFNINGDVV